MAAAYLTPFEHWVVDCYDKQDLSFRGLAKKRKLKDIEKIRKTYFEARSKIDAAANNQRLEAFTFNPAPSSSSITTLAPGTVTTPNPTTSAFTSTSRSMSSNMNNNTNPSNLTPNLTPTMPNMTTPAIPNPTEGEDRSKFIPWDDPRRIYHKIPGTDIAFCHPNLTGNLSGHLNTPEEQAFVDDLRRKTLAECAGKSKAELKEIAAATRKKVQDDWAESQAIIADIDRQKKELIAQHEVERRVFLRQKALKEEKRKLKEEKLRAKAAASGEVVDGGEGPSGMGQGSGTGDGGAGTGNGTAMEDIATHFTGTDSGTTARTAGADA